ncbi:LytTR family DNA-binding domain-containing protein [Persicitalea jodogahamensis]|uniref:HTH LytTR-type domain-containing protein n=1 Tax=Persicitalea jodogahamensis TaxID=402147 RepID=A0A8J3GCY4_9BACT|nr:LytTR family DNA-binding domain-containing protein [Persicitalea jodogahamensis]GHB87476.1 hypothetical protein GCM10007390_49210 [Persicitalea jodogahamensis]
MKTLELYRSFLKKPWVGVMLVSVVMLLLEINRWMTNPQAQVQMLEKYHEGAGGYVLNLVFGVYVPELVTVGVLILLMEAYHRLLNIHEVGLDTRSIALYELKFLPLFLMAYFFFIPFTLAVRFAIREFPDYNAQRYENNYARILYTWVGYNTYTLLVTVIGYLLLNISLLLDFLRNLRLSFPPGSSLLDSLAAMANDQPRDHKQTITVTSVAGETILSVAQVDLFETQDGTNYARHDGNRSVVHYSLAELENQLDPDRFFRGNRHYIVNLDHLESHSYWDKGKYVLRSRNLPGRDLIMPRARLQGLRAALKRNRAQFDPLTRRSGDQQPNS